MPSKYERDLERQVDRLQKDREKLVNEMKRVLRVADNAPNREVFAEIATDCLKEIGEIE